MNIFKKFRRDTDRIVSGAVCELGRTDDDKPVEVLVARAHDSHPLFAKRTQELYEQHQAQLNALKKDKEATSELRQSLALRSFVETCIKGWSNLEDDEGKPFVYNEENLARLHELPELVEKLFLFGVDDSNYLGTFDEETSLKN